MVSMALQRVARDEQANMSLPVAVLVSSGWLPDIDRTLKLTFLVSS